jgi:hypothetical protein
MTAVIAPLAGNTEDKPVVRRFSFVVVTSAICLLQVGSQPVEAAGYWNVPSNFCQCAGCGFGGGYHAPLVLGPMSCHGWCAKNHYRLPHAPAPCYGCGHCGGGFEQPTIMDPPPQPAVAPIAPVSRTHRPLFLR